MKDKNDLIKDITEHLDQSLETLDPKILSRISAARYNALEKKRPGFIQWALPVGGIAVAAVVLFVSVNLFMNPEKSLTTQLVEITKTTAEKPESEKEELPVKINTEPEIQAGQVELVEILSSDQQLDLFENLEFYVWLAENENFTG